MKNTIHMLKSVTDTICNSFIITTEDDKLIVMLKRYTVLPLIMMFLCLPVKDWLSRFFRKTGRRAVWGGILGTATLSVLLVLSLIFLLGQTYNPFIYFRF